MAPDWLPEDVSPKGIEAAGATFAHEVAGESAASLGRAGQAVERALRALREHEGDPNERDDLVKAAADAAYAYLVQREVLGQTDQAEAIRAYGIPSEVIARLGGR